MLHHSAPVIAMRGFTLAELIAVFLLTSILAAGVTHLFSEAIKSINISEQRVVATQLAQQRAEQVMAERRDERYATFALSPDDVILGTTTYNRTITSTPLTGGACPSGMSCKQVEVAVAGSGTTEAAVTLLLVDY